MKAAPFDYHAAATVSEAVAVLAGDEGARVLAGGQSLVPLLAMRLARPTVLVDINPIGLDAFGLDPDGAGSAVLRLGALVRHRRLERDATIVRACPVLADAARLIGHPAIRNRGSIGGSLVHADPAAELPAVLVATGGTVVTVGPGGRREIGADQLFGGFFTTTLAPDELLIEVRIPVLAGPLGGALCEWAPRRHDFAEVGVAVTVRLDSEGAVATVGAAACGVSSVPLRLTEALAEAGVLGAASGSAGVSAGLVSAVSTRVARACAGAGGDKATLAGLLAARAVVRALRGAAQCREEAA